MNNDEMIPCQDLTEDSNTSNNTHFQTILDQHMNRRGFIAKTTSGAMALAFAASVSGCSDDDNDSANSGENPTTPPDTTSPDQHEWSDLNARPNKLTFEPVRKNTANFFSVPAGYQLKVLYAVGDPINPTYPEKTDAELPSGASYQFRAGDNHDGMSFFGMHPTNKNYAAKESKQGLLVLNHEYLQQSQLHTPVGTISVDGIRPEDQVLREVNAHGVSVVEISKDENTQDVKINLNSEFNRRITAATEMDIRGPARGSDLVKTRFSQDGTLTRGTFANCGNGYTPWGTYLTAEENWSGYFARQANDTRAIAKEEIALSRYGRGGANARSSQYLWNTPVAELTDDKDLYDRWDISVKGENALADYRNVMNTCGFIVEIDPFSATERPVKRTALGRFAHEDCRCSNPIPGQPLAFYMGDDATGEYIYKFVSDAVWDPKDVNGGYAAGDKYMNNGTLYVAKFNDDGTGEWLELSHNQNGLTSANAIYPFSGQDDVVVHARLAADHVGATKMDRPEWVAVNPENGEVYVTLTNNSSRGRSYPTDAANPRSYIDFKGTSASSSGNMNGHIIRFREEGDTVAATAFKWDIFLFGAEARAESNINLSGLDDMNDFSSPDGMWFDPRGILWIQTDDGQYTDETNCMMLAALPGSVGDGGTAIAASTKAGGQETIVGAQLSNDRVRRFLVGPSGCEITGVTITPDYKAIFVNVQHPGGAWPANQSTRYSALGKVPRSATVVITRKDGGPIAGEALEQA
ncbi:PhoX family phosphatase [Acinetobacter indicus]|uniref:PhoX family protein n=1 Tax=Acinetobacter indicus TaxID=756892 RepID=UPI0025762B66|nr:PhoX family phosphatase [Acinetobacter indicus]MDM1277084.1 PhoX family phosphatase [Acinetobacter indicus]